MRRKLTDEHIASARKLRAEGMPWYRIGKALGLSEMTVRCALDPAYAAMLLERRRINRRKNGASKPITQVEGISSTREAARRDALARLAEIPADTRSLTAFICGDPLPGRSAWDRRLAEDYDLACEGAR